MNLWWIKRELCQRWVTRVIVGRRRGLMGFEDTGATPEDLTLRLLRMMKLPLWSVKFEEYEARKGFLPWRRLALNLNRRIRLEIEEKGHGRRSDTLESFRFCLSRDRVHLIRRILHCLDYSRSSIDPRNNLPLLNSFVESRLFSFLASSIQWCAIGFFNFTVILFP